MEQFVAAVDAMKMGLPWESGVEITPLPEEGKPGYINELLKDALAKVCCVVCV